LFSFQHIEQSNEDNLSQELCPDLGLRPGGIVEWLAATPGAGAVACAMQAMSRYVSVSDQGILVVVDASREFHAPALSGWGISLGRTLLVYPGTRQEACWAIEQCLRCPGVSAVCAWVAERFPTHVQRRWQLAAEAGGGVGMFFRPEAARREPVWADVRLLVTPLAGDRGEARRMRIDVLYRRGGLGGTARVWEIDHAEGLVRVVPKVAGPATAARAAGA
jgi:protein ImuA